MSQRLAHGTEASTSRAAPLAPDAATSQLEQRLHHPGVLQTLLDEAQAEQALWQEFRVHDASLNAALTEVLRLHGGPSFQLFEVSIFA
jgi:DNA polymerase III psi subunit